jgi:hypothetical protein
VWARGGESRGLRVERAGGAFGNRSAPAPLRDALVSTRFDDQLSTRNTLMVRYSFNRSTDIGPASPAQAEPAFSAAERQNSFNHFNSVDYCFINPSEQPFLPL